MLPFTPPELAGAPSDEGETCNGINWPLQIGRKWEVRANRCDDYAC